MRWLTLVFPVALFCSLSFVNAIPHDADEKRHWLHKRQRGSGSSSSSEPVVSTSSVSVNPPPSAVSSTSSTSTQSPRPSSSSSSSSPRSPTPTPSPSSGSLSSTDSGSSSSSTSSLSSGSTSSTSSSFSTTTSRPGTNQGYTSYRRFSSTLGVSSDTDSASGGVETGSGSGNSFLKNKAAVGSTFAIVGLVGAALIAGAIFYMTKKARQRKHQDELDTYFEKLPANRITTRIKPSTNGAGNDFGLGPSATDVTTPADEQAYMPRDVHYGATSQYPEQYPSYNGLEYPPERGSVVERPVSYAPGTAYAAAMSQPGQYNHGEQLEDPNAVPNHPFADPEHRFY